MPAEMRVLRTHDDIRAAIEGKATKYGDLDCPLIFAVNVLDDFCDDGDIWNALFGEEQVVLTRQADGHFRHDWGQRAPNGAWRGRRGPRNRLVSVASISHCISPSTLRSTSVGLIHNPWTVNPLAIDALPLPQITISLTDGRIHKHDGTHHADLMDINDPWPRQD